MDEEWDAGIQKQLLTSDFSMDFQWICYKNSNNISCTKCLAMLFIWQTILYPLSMTIEKLIFH